MPATLHIDPHPRLELVRRALLVLAAGACLFVPPAASAADGDAQPMSAAESYRLTCGHLGVSCDQSHASHRTHAARSHRRRSRPHRRD